MVDLGWPDRRVAIEVDGYEHHGGRRHFYRGIERDNAIRDAGYELRRFSWDDLQRRPERVVATAQRFLCRFSAPMARKIDTEGEEERGGEVEGGHRPVLSPTEGVDGADHGPVQLL